MKPPADAGQERAPSRDRLLSAWYAPRLTGLALALLPLSWVFACIVAARRALYRRGALHSVRIGVPVIVVGNIVVGGSGKTPLVIALARSLAARGRKPGIVSRGHGAKAQREREVHASDDAALVGDEPLLCAAAGFPVWIGRDRVAAANGLRAAHPDCNVVLSDDGLQHYRLARDVEIAAVDASRGLGNGQLLPAGPLREPASRLNAVDAVAELVSPRRAAGPAIRGTSRRFAMTHEPVGWRNLVEPARPFDPSRWTKGSVHAVAGTANPQRFFDLLAALGIDAIPHAFPDHHAYVADDLAFPGAEAILMTAKDAVKCARFADARCFALDIRAVLDPALVDLVLERIDGRQAA